MVNLSGAGLVHVIGALTWNPGIRGVLVVAVGAAVLMGSVFVLLSTNSGIRLGGLLAVTGFFGWMFLMGVVWSMYGIGYKGPAPTWKVKEVSYDTSVAQLAAAHTIPNPNSLPSAQSFIDKSPSLKQAFANQQKPPNLGDLLGVQPDLIKQIPVGSSWELLATSDPMTGDAVATATSFLGSSEANICPSSTDCVEVNAFNKGGKPRRTDDSVLGRVWYKIKTAFTVKNPPHYAVVQFRKAIPQVTEPGAAPPVPVADQNSPVISVIMERDIGAKRLPSLVLTLLMGVCFGICCNVLHRREKLSVRNRAEAT